MALLAPDTRRIAPVDPTPAPDRIPDELAAGTPEPLRSDLIGLLGAERVLTRVIDLARYASDASCYRLLPKAIVMARDVDDITKVLAYARRTGTPVTLRAGGTSLNGQAQGDGILVDVRQHWRGVEPLDGGKAVRVRPGTVLGYANRVLAPLGYGLGPDPASKDIATVGGVIANNSGGMRCGTTKDAYQTLRSMTFVLPSGTVIDTAEPNAAERFQELEPELAAGLAAMRKEILDDGELAARIAQKFEIKNTTGYRLCAFLDAEEPLEIFRRLIVGSEGTLAFVAEAVFETVLLPKHTTVSWLHFADIDAACLPVPDLVATGATAVELMVAPALIAASFSIPGTPESWRELPPESAALLVEYGADEASGLDAAQAKVAEVLASHELIQPSAFTREEEEIELAWRVREGLHGLVGRFRPPSAALIVEDVCVPPAHIAEAAADLRKLLEQHGFLSGVAGHASAGNLHFMLTPEFAQQSERDRYDAFMGDLVKLIVDQYDGSLKAEHGTGLNMAPFVEHEWGSKAYELMWRVKELADPDGILGRGVLLNRDPDVHLHNLKTIPAIEQAGDATICVECGFCEPVCPSRWLTTTPRQRIVIRREMARQPEGSPVLHALLEQFEYDGLQTCAVDGACATVCPLGIDTGKLVKELRAGEHTERADRVALQAARRWRSIEHGARRGLRAADTLSRALGNAPMRAGTGAARAIVSKELVPSWPSAMPHPAPPRLPATTRAGAAAVYLPACINRIFGRAHGKRGEPSLPEALVAVSARAGVPLWIPEDAAGHCCGVPWSSKGYRDGHAHMVGSTVAALWRWSGQGELPIVIDASSCTQGLVSEAAAVLDAEGQGRINELQILDSIQWAKERLLPRLEVSRRVGTVAIHPTCAARQMGLADSLAEIGAALAEEVIVPPSATCCGFAGDRGMLHPELPAAATADQAAELDGRTTDACISSNRTCEIGLSGNLSRPYESFVHLLEELTRG